jgi:hypothetical protein|tara:strand:+ start:6083 stop:6235 length:153 start_codon:yes stop_codon:yes gene_type:complete
MGVQVVPHSIAIVILIGERQICTTVEIHPVWEKEVVASSIEFPTLSSPAS